MARKRESLSHATSRMLHEGYTPEQVQGQIRKWHPTWSQSRIGTYVPRSSVPLPPSLAAKTPIPTGPRPAAPASPRTRTPRTSYPATSGLGAAAASQGAKFVPSRDDIAKAKLARENQRMGQKAATIWAAKHSPAVASHLLAPSPPAPKLPPVPLPARGHVKPAQFWASQPSYKQVVRHYTPTKAERDHAIKTPVPGKKGWVYLRDPQTKLPLGTYVDTQKTGGPIHVDPVEQQYRWAQQALNPVHPQHDQGAAALAATMTQSERDEQLHPEIAYQRYLQTHPLAQTKNLPWYKRYSPEYWLAGAAQEAGALAQPLAGLVSRVEHNFATGLTSAGTQGQVPAEAGILPPEALPNLGIGAAKMLAAGVPAIAGLPAHPVRTVDSMIQMLRGSVTVPISVIAGADPRYSYEQRKYVANSFTKAALQDIIDRYGPNTSWREVLSRGYNDPVVSLLNAAIVAGPVTKYVTLARYFRVTGSIEDALALTRDPALYKDILGTENVPRWVQRAGDRTLTYHGKESGDISVQAQPSRTPLARGLVDKPYDLLSKGVERVGGSRLPFSESSRALRLQKRRVVQQVRRLSAEGAALVHQVSQYVERNPEQRARLFHTLQRPADVPEEVWLQSVVKDLEAGLTGRKIQGTVRVSEHEQRLERRLARFKKNVDDLSHQKLAEKMTDVHHEQHALGHALLNTEEDMKLVRQRMREATADPQLDETTRGRIIQVHKDDEKTLVNRREALRQQLADLTVEQPAVESATKAELQSKVEQLSNISSEQADGLFQIFDARARQWAQETGRDPGEWYSDPSGLGVREIKMIDDLGHDVPVAAYTQQRGVVRPTQFDARTHATALLDRYTPVKKRGEKRPKIAGLPKNLKGSRAAFARLLDDMAGRLEAGRAFAEKWYENSGREILAATGGDVDRADLVAQLTAIYSPQKPVAPNIALALRVLSDWEDGRGVRFGNRHQKALARKALAGKDWIADLDPSQMPKVRRFYANLLKHIAPDRLAAKGFNGREVTVDGWMGAAFGYGFNTGNSGLTAAQFRVVEDIVQHLADHYGMEPEAAQAAIWTSIKAERDRSTAAMYANPETRLQALQKAGESFADSIFTPKNTLRLPFESHSPEKAFLNDLTPEQLAAHTAEYGNAFLRVLHDEGFIARRDEGGISFWRNPATGEIESNPAQAVEIALGDRPVTKMKGAEVVEQTSRNLYLRVPPKMEELANGLAAAFGDAAEQAQAGWARYLNPRGQRSDVTAWRIDRGRPLTAEEVDTLTAHLPDDAYYSAGDQGGIIHLNDPNAVLDRSIRVAGQHRRGDKAGARQARKVLSDEAVARREQIDAAIHVVFPDPEDHVDVVDLAHRGNLIDRGDYHAQISGGRRSDLFERVRDHSAAHFAEIDRQFQSDPAAAAERAQRYPGSLSLQPAEHADAVGQGRAPPTATLAQTRRSDLLGAVQFLNSEDGSRILYLGERADVSTLLHELIGHGAREMKAAYPEQFADVETIIGRPLEEWTREDHEHFARMAERFFADGLAPTPELVPILQHTKTWMRSIYGGMKSLGQPLPAEARTLFNHYFGAYNDEHMFRIAAIETRLPTAARMARGQALFDFTSEELATLRRRKAAQVFARSIDGIEKRIDELVKKGRKDGGLDEADQAKLDQLAGRAIELKAEEANAIAQRQRRLSDRLDELNAAMASPVGEGYDVAVDALRGLIDKREELLRTVFGSKYDETFSNRVDLMANWLVDQGYLETHEFQNGSAYFVPHRPEGGGKPPRAIKQPARALATPVVGKPDTSLLGLHKQNNLIRWQEGDIWADPKVVVEAWQNAQAFSFVHEIAQKLWDLGTEWHSNEPFPDNVYAINLEGKPIPALQRRTMPPASTDEVETALKALEAQDPEALNASLLAYANDILLDPARAQEVLATYDPSNLNIRLVDARVVESLLRPLQGGRWGGVGTFFDAANTLARWSLIYSNPAYVPVNFIGNSFFLLGQQGPRAIEQLVRASKMILTDKELAIRVAAETGELPYQAAISRGRGFDRRTAEIEQKALHAWTAIPDRLPRMAAWIYEAKRLGYQTREDMIKLLEGKDAKHERDRNTVSERSTDIMVRFDRLSDWERGIVTKVLFIWPWIRGATAWPFHYAREFPVATGIASNYARQGEQRRQQLMEARGPIPDYRRDMQPLSITDQGPYRTALAINTAPISPGSTAAQMLEMIRGNVMSALGAQKEVEQGNRIIDFLNPMWTMLVEGAASQTLRGKSEPLWKIGAQNALSFIPFASTAWQVYDPYNKFIPVSKANVDKSWEGVLRRKFVRLWPEEVSINWLNYQAQQRGDPKSFTQLVNEEVAREQAAYKKLTAKAPNAAPYSQENRRAVIRKLAFQQKIQDLTAANKNSPSWVPVKDDKGNWKVAPSVTPWEEAQAAYVTMVKYPIAGLKPEPPSSVLIANINGQVKHLSPNSETGKLILKKYVSAFHSMNAKLTSYGKLEKKSESGMKVAREMKVLRGE